ncbi:MAG TPA: hypothetical protein VM686_05725 [Polyangiaceae bacterium]|nr:hypothetical protein [Polyangiaceae bacterium]
MRWFVEISTIGDSAAPARLCVDAGQWQSAFEEARRLLKDAGPLSKFSIEVLDDGYRAVNPAQRTRYVIRRAPEAAALTDESSVRPSSIPPPGDWTDSAAARPLPESAAALTVPSDTVPPAPPAPSQQQPLPRSAVAEQPAAVSLVAESLPSPLETAASWLMRRRTEQATADSPLVYCELAYSVAPGVSRQDVERVLLQRFREVCAELEGQLVRKYVQLAIFDHDFEERPLRAPLATLAWKDWRGVPAIGFPAFGEAAPLPSSQPPRIPGWAGTPSEPPSAPLQSRPGSSIPPSSDSVRVIRSVPVHAALPEIESGPEEA